MDNPFAFPVSTTFGLNGEVSYGGNGMTMRQWYKGMAMQGLLATSIEVIFKQEKVESRQDYALLSAKMADAMLAEDEEHAKVNP